ncbi:hypothetical protein CEUSTIGMA_g6131.t1 [Chlamydomonas eustigma]|uniref:RWD domain-containing protein n=1 Tax=Chlamydomonas eustigma TaxID=1157962 RepID=A0A250X6I6_9CHLO|nr:hypothetical protein CEUSTIGMA_g6131.t1 [Chlamydomonas eustigma]|eukprot:GAX78693.1 hypothetical protein CEUSTIGMA_g6131.t1 [Chlamydomonas eustigma]
MDAQALEEMEALAAIYGEDCGIDVDVHTVHAYLPSKSCVPHLVVSAHLHTDYPAHTAPLLEFHAPPHVSNDMIAAALRDMDQLFIPGEVVLFRYIEWLKDQPQLYNVDAVKACSAAALDKAHDPQDVNLPIAEKVDAKEASSYDMGPAIQGLHKGGDANSELVVEVRQRIVSGPPIIEKKSTFQAHLASVNSVEEVTAVMDALLQVTKIANATHNIMAYRIYSLDKQSFIQDSDDDGESAAGGRLLHLLQVTDVRNVVVVVSRWFGGVLLGPSRFSFINNTARQLLENQGFLRGNVDTITVSKRSGCKKNK